MSNIDYSLQKYQRPVLKTPNGEKRLLLHSCCAPCASEIMLALSSSKISTTIFFYNPNIHPQEEYEIRKQENIKFANKIGMNFIDADYDKDRWFSVTKGLENEPERGKRCSVCFDMRFDVSAKYAVENGFDLISSTLGISRWKDIEQINNCGKSSGKKYNISYWDFNWRKKGGSSRMLEISKAESFYQQEYCGCVHSLRDTNKWRLSKGKNKIKRGAKFYHNIDK